MQNTRTAAMRDSLRAPEAIHASYLWRDLADEINNSPEWAEAMQFGVYEALDTDVMKTNYVPLGGGGTSLRVRLAKDLVAMLVNVVQPVDSHQTVRADVPVLMLRASLSSGTAYTVPGMPAMLFNRPEVVIAYVPVGAEIRIDIHAHARQHGLLLFMDARAFLPHFGLSAGAVPASIRDMFDGEGEPGMNGRVITLPLDSRMAALVETATQPLRNPALARLATAGAVNELAALVLDAAERNPSFAGSSGLRRRDLQLAYAAREVLDRDAAAPPLLSKLARDIGTNAKTLKVAFREAFGLTMADYCVQRRMRMAQALLLDGTLTIGQVADRVGYSHQSSFTAAFRDHAGVAPKEYRRHRAALDVSIPPIAKPKAERSA